jgi:hypothetical protein
MRLRIALGLALVVAAASVLAAGPVSAGTAPPLPDLEQVAPYSVSADAVHSHGRTHFRLLFGSASQNIGRGRLVIVGHRPDTATSLMTADQLIETGDPANPQRVPGVGVLRYTYSPDHQHWHFLDYMRYELHRASDFRLVGHDHKTGVCLGDRFPVGVFPRHGAPAAGPRFATASGFDDQCGLRRPDLLDLTEGISPGVGDDYRAGLEGQFIDITTIRSGRYVLVHRTNAARRIRESNYANNVASALLDISVDRRRRRVPRVTVLKTCWASERCR